MVFRELLRPIELEFGNVNFEIFVVVDVVVVVFVVVLILFQDVRLN